MIYQTTKFIAPFPFYSDRVYPSYDSAIPPNQEGNLTAEGACQKFIVDETHQIMSMWQSWDTDEHQAPDAFIKGYVKGRPESWTGTDAELDAMIGQYATEQAAIFALYTGGTMPTSGYPANPTVPHPASVAPNTPLVSNQSVPSAAVRLTALEARMTAIEKEVAKK